MSKSGCRRGLSDSRSGLVTAFFTLLDVLPAACRPTTTLFMFQSSLFRVHLRNAKHNALQVLLLDGECEALVVGRDETALRVYFEGSLPNNNYCSRMFKNNDRVCPTKIPCVHPFHPVFLRYVSTRRNSARGATSSNGVL